MFYKASLLILALFLSACHATQPTLADSYLYHEQIQHQKWLSRDMKDRISTERILESIDGDFN